MLVPVELLNGLLAICARSAAKPLFHLAPHQAPLRIILDLRQALLAAILMLRPVGTPLQPNMSLFYTARPGRSRRVNAHRCRHLVFRAGDQPLPAKLCIYANRGRGSVYRECCEQCYHSNQSSPYVSHETPPCSNPTSLLPLKCHRRYQLHRDRNAGTSVRTSRSLPLPVPRESAAVAPTLLFSLP